MAAATRQYRPRPGLLLPARVRNAWLNCDLRVEQQVVLITGFATRIDSWSGLRILYSKIRNDFAGPQCSIYLRQWSDNFDQLAHVLAMERKTAAELAVIAHSYGNGRGVTRLARALAGRGIDINLLCAIDPVPRLGSTLPADRIFGAVLSGLALTSWGTYHVPENVEEVAIWRTNNHDPFDPIGRRLAVPDECRFLREVVLGAQAPADPREYSQFIRDDAVRHDTIDNHPDVHDQILSLLSERILT